MSLLDIDNAASNEDGDGPVLLRYYRPSEVRGKLSGFYDQLVEFKPIDRKAFLYELDRAIALLGLLDD